jgi:hypothetical protein
MKTNCLGLCNASKLLDVFHIEQLNFMPNALEEKKIFMILISRVNILNAREDDEK